MPPKTDKEATPLEGFDMKETKLLAGAFVASTGGGKIDYKLYEQLTGYTAGTLNKFWPPIKRKAAELHPSFGGYVGLTGEGGAKTAAAPKTNAAKKRKAPEVDQENDGDGADDVHADAEVDGDAPKEKTKEPKTKAKAPVAKKPKVQKKTKKAETEVKDEEEDDN